MEREDVRRAGQISLWLRGGVILFGFRGTRDLPKLLHKTPVQGGVRSQTFGVFQRRPSHLKSATYGRTEWTMGALYCGVMIHRGHDAQCRTPELVSHTVWLVVEVEWPRAVQIEARYLRTRRAAATVVFLLTGSVSAWCSSLQVLR